MFAIWLAFKTLLTKLWREIASYPAAYLLLFFIFIGGLWVRTSNLDKLLGFYYDQGRDGLVVEKILNGDLTLIGPTTGIEGLFHGPLYYYLLAPNYVISDGDPAGAALLLGIFNSLAIILMYVAGLFFFSRAAGLIAAFMFAFSQETVIFSRWFSNPSPQMAFTILALIGLWMLLKKNGWGLPLFIFGAFFGFHFEAVSIITFLPAGIAFGWWQLASLRQIVRPSQILVSCCLLLIALSPYIIFESRHGLLMTKALSGFITADSTFQVDWANAITKRLTFYLEVYNNLLFRQYFLTQLALLSMIVISGWVFIKKIFPGALPILWLWVLSPLVVLLFYHGNYGYVWGYYLAPTLPAVILILAGFVYLFVRTSSIGALVAVMALGLFWLAQQPLLARYTATDISYGPETIVLGNQLQAIDWIYQDAQKQPFNVDVYVPPVIPYAYDYLLSWYGTKYFHMVPVTEQAPLLYTLYEVDPPHPERLNAWLLRQQNIAPRVNKEASFGGITVQRRQRISL